MNVIDESGLLAISTRLQRLSEQIRKDGALIYKAHGIDFEPKWFPVIYTLHHKPVLSVVEPPIPWFPDGGTSGEKGRPRGEGSLLSGPHRRFAGADRRSLLRRNGALGRRVP